MGKVDDRPRSVLPDSGRDQALNPGSIGPGGHFKNLALQIWQRTGEFRFDWVDPAGARNDLVIQWAEDPQAKDLMATKRVALIEWDHWHKRADIKVVGPR